MPTPRSPFYFDKAKADAAVEFFPRFLCFVDGEWAGRPFHLSPWEARDVRQIFGWRRRKNGLRRYRFARLWVPRKNGKGLALDTPLPTPSGWTTMGQVAVGDKLFDEAGRECAVTFVSETHYLDCFEIEFSNGERIVCDGDHRWLTTARIDQPGLGVGRAKIKSKKGETLTCRVRNTREIYASVVIGSRADRNHSLAMPAPICGRRADLPIDPYVLGLWLGDGSSHYAAITIGDRDRDELVAAIQAAGVPVWVSKPKKGSAWLAHLTIGGRHGGQLDCVQSRLRDLGILGAKRIPPLYLRASVEQRLALLQGLMDSDGHVAAHGEVMEIATTLAGFGDDVAELLAGMGVKFSRRIVSMRCNGKPVEGDAHRFQFCVSRDLLPAFRLRRKLSRQKTGDLGRSRSVQIARVKPVQTVPTRCIQVDSASHLFRCGRTMLPTHNTELAAGLGHLLTIGDGEPGAQVYSHALDSKQAGIAYEKAARMVALSRPLSELYEVTKTGMICTSALNACFRPLSGGAYGKHGLSPHANIGDEAHAWRDGNLHTFLLQGMGSRRQPLDITISTAGQIRTYGHELYLASKAILADPDSDPQTYVSIYEADADDDWTDPKVWAKANPNLGISLKPEFLAAECRRAQATPRLENDFRRYHLNQWVEQAKRWFPMRLWDANTEAPSNAQLWQELPARMRGRAAFAALDLGSTDDITALVWCFMPDSGGRVVLIPRFWVPQDKVAERDSPRSPYRRWISEGALFTTPGNVTDYDFIEEQVMRDCEQFRCNGLAIDRWNATQVAVHLGEQGLPVQLFGQGFASMGSPSKEIERLFLSGQIEHGNHPVLKWMFGNATYRPDPAGNIKPDKERAADKIDGVVAAVMALGLATKGDVSSSNVFDVLAMSAGLVKQVDNLVPDIDQETAILRDPLHPRWNEMRERYNDRLSAQDESEDAF